MATNGRLRDDLAKDEVWALLRKAKRSKRHGTRNYPMVLLTYRHGLRASEVVELGVSDVNSRAGTIYCRRRKGSESSVHPIKRDELEALEHVMRDREVEPSDYAFDSERGAKQSQYGSSRIVSEAGKGAGLLQGGVRKVEV